MRVELSADGRQLSIETELDLNKPSRSGQSTILATTRGQQYVGNINGKPTYVQLNVMQMDSGAAGGGVVELVSPKKAPGRAA